MLAKILWSFVLVSTLYLVSVFFAPTQADRIGDLLGIRPINDVLRNVKAGGSQDVRVEFWSGSGGILNELKQKFDGAKTVLDTTRSTIETKAEQTKTVVDSVQNAATAIQKVKSDVDALTTFSGVQSGTGASSATNGSSTESNQGQTILFYGSGNTQITKIQK